MSHGGIPGVMQGMGEAGPDSMGLSGAVAPGFGMIEVGEGIPLVGAGLAGGQEYDFIHICSLYISFFPTWE